MDNSRASRKIDTVPRRTPGVRTASPFVGRDDLVHHLAEALTMAAEGQGGIIFLTGQPGIGKTRLARVTLALAMERGFTVLQGRAYPLGASLAYAPILNAIGPLLRSLDPARLAALVDGLPDLGRLFGDLRIPPPNPLGDPALEKTRLFEAATRLLERLSDEAPLVLFIDDLHWADAATFELLHYIARSLYDRHALLLATHTVDNVDATSGLRTLLGSLDRDGIAEEIVVPRLGRDAVDQLARSILGGETQEDLLTLLEARAGGTPLFVEALIASLVESGNLVCQDGVWVLDAEGAGTLPPGVRRLIRGRLDRLATIDRHLLELIAVMGDATPHNILREMAALEEEALIEAIGHLRSAGLVTEGMSGPDLTYSISHSLIQEVAYADLPEAARRRAHLSAISALERLRPEDVDRLTRHYRSAGSDATSDRALATLTTAGDRARSIFANEEAARHYSAALAIIRKGGGRRVKGGGDTSPLNSEQSTLNPQITTLNPHPLALAALLESLGEVQERLGEHKAAVEVWNEALAERERSGDFIAAARLHARLTLVEWELGHFETANAHVNAGLLSLADREPSQELADLYYARFNLLNRMGDTTGVAETANDLLALAERLASPRTEAVANLVASLSFLRQDDIINSRERASLALIIGEQLGDPAICWRAHDALGLGGARLGDHQSMLYHSERGLATARRLGAPTMEIISQLRLAYAHFMAGAWDDALKDSMEAIVLSRRVGYPRDLSYSMAGRALVLAFRGNLPEAEACVSEVRAAFGTGTPADRQYLSPLDIAETALALEMSQVERALDIARSFSRPSTVAGRPAYLTPMYMPMGLALLAETQTAAGDAEAAIQTAQRLTVLGPADTPYLLALATRAEGLAKRALGQSEAAIDCLARAYETFAELGIPFEAARCLLEQAEIENDSSHPRQAVSGARFQSRNQVIGQSLAIFERLGAGRYADRARRLLRGPEVLPLSGRRTRLSGVSISGRELEIARLIAEGLTTAEIAERLTISPRTVGTHLRRVYSRLGINSRTALARLVIEAGLL